MHWSQCCCVGYLLAILTSFAIITLSDADGCHETTLSHSPGVLNITYDKDNKTMCYKFTIQNVTGNIFFHVLSAPTLNHTLDSISVYNINTTGGLYLVSSKTFKHSIEPHPGYLVVGYGALNASVDKNASSVSLVYVNVTEPLAKNDSYTIVKYSNDTANCSLELAMTPDELTVPDYQPGLNTSFNCRYTYQDEGNSESSDSYVFTSFNFSSPSSHLEVEASGPAGTFSGTDLPYDTLVPSNLTVTMSINAATNDTYAAYKVPYDASCTTTLYVNASGAEIRSKGYVQGEYSNNLDCRPVIISDDLSKQLMMTMVDVDLALDSDHVQVIDGGASRAMTSNLLAYYSALDGYKAKGSVVVTSGPAVMVRFKTDELGTAKGYKMIVNQTDLGRTYYTPSVIEFTATTNTEGKDFQMVVMAPTDFRVELVPFAINSSDGSVVCYGGSSSKDKVVASYRAGMFLYPSYSMSRRMLCIAKGFKAGDNFSAKTSAVTRGFTVVSTKDVGSVTLDMLISHNTTSNWIVQPDAYNSSVIELMITRLSLPEGSASYLTLGVHSMTNITYANVTVNTRVPYIVRVPKSTGLRLSITCEKANFTSNVTLSLSASYILDNSTVHVGDNQLSGVITSPGYPRATPSLTNNTWIFTVPALKSYQFSFDSKFEMCNKSFLNVSSPSAIYINVSGPSVTAPSDVILNNTKYNESIQVTVSLVSPCQTNVTGVRILYSRLESGYSSGLSDSQMMTSPNYPNPLTTSYKASWVLSVPVNNSAGLVERIQAQVLFTPSPNTRLELRDGPRYDSPLMTVTNVTPSALSLRDDFKILMTTSNYIYVGYSYSQNVVNQTGSPFKLNFLPDVCTRESQCILLSNTSVCMPDSWKCDGIYQCKDGMDEMNCTMPATTTQAPAVTKQGAKWWVVVLCMLAGVVIGSLISVLCILVVMRRRGSGYNRLSELMTPVPT